jgi:long-chain acyl-CoA synthetase
MIESHVDEVNRDLAREERVAGCQIRRFLILHKELDADDGEITRTNKVRRAFVAERYAALIEALYEPATTRRHISTEVTFEDGRKGVIAADIEIRDMPARAPQTLKEAAE